MRELFEQFDFATVSLWGNSGEGRLDLPGVTNVKAIACGAVQSLVLFENGTVRMAGRNQYQQTNVPADLQTDVIALAAGEKSSLAVLSDGTVRQWSVHPNHAGGAHLN
jgi:alpha-tubulin suppressor-like RCC1 family protein